MTNEEMIQRAASVIRTRKTKYGLIGDVGCAVLSCEGKLYLGVCAACGSNVFCAEQNAIGSMITDGVYRLSKVVAVWKDEHESLHVIAPCGNCRQMMKELDKDNLKAQVILDRYKAISLQDLLPYHDWWKKQ